MTAVIEAFQDQNLPIASQDTDWALTNPSGITVGELLILWVIKDGSGLINPTSGWTSISRDDGAGLEHYVAWRIADGTEGATTTITSLSNPNPMCGGIFRISGHNGLGVVGSVVNSGSQTTHDFTEITTLLDDVLVISLFGFDGGDGGTFSISTGGATYTIQNQENSGTGTEDVSCCYATHVQATAGACPALAIDSTALDGSFTLQIGIAPALGKYDQEGFRWRNDDGSESAATWKENQDTNTTVAKETRLRLRILSDLDGDGRDDQLKLQYRRKGDTTPWEDIET